MRKLLALLGIVALMGNPLAAMADDADDGTLCSYCWPKGAFTEENPEASKVLLFPVRVVTAGVGAPVGALTGASEGTLNALDSVSDVTFARVRTDEYDDEFTNGTVSLLKAPILLPLGVAGTAVAIPLGFTYGAVTGTFEGLAKGYMWPDTF